jgi:hypothetical protein
VPPRPVGSPLAQHLTTSPPTPPRGPAPQGKKPDKVNPAEELLARWTRCHLSNERLNEPVVADDLGSLFNKEAIVAALLSRSMPTALAHITSLKQLTQLKLDPVPRRGAGAAAAPAAAKGGGGAPPAAAEWQCPVTGLEMNGRARFVVHRPSGVALAERALRDAPAAVEELLGGPWAQEDLIVVNPAGEELQRAKEALAAKLAAERAKKLAKKLAKKAGAVATAAAAAGGEERAAAAAAPAGERQSGSPDSSGNGSGGGAATASGKRAAPDAPAAARANGAAAPAAAAAANGGGKPAAKKMRLPEGATAEVYNSIFHTAEQAAAQKETYSCRAVSGRWRC